MKKEIAKGQKLGKVALDLQKKEPVTNSAKETADRHLEEYVQELYVCVDRAKKELQGDFFVTVLTKREKLLTNVMRNFFMFRISCPTPRYDQAVYHYHAKDDALEMLWVIPNKETCVRYIQYASQVPPDRYYLLDYVLKFSDGKLFELAKKLNGESLKSMEIEN